MRQLFSLPDSGVLVARFSRLEHAEKINSVACDVPHIACLDPKDREGKKRWIPGYRSVVALCRRKSLVSKKKHAAQGFHKIAPLASLLTARFTQTRTKTCVQRVCVI